MLKSEVDKLSLMEVELSTINLAAKQIIAFAKNNDVWLVNGDMGSGKTTLVKAICKMLNVLDNVTSPTFSIVNEYITQNDEICYHFDFYRIKSEVEAEDIGCEEYFYSGNKCFIEWSSKIPNLLPENRVEINISIVDNLKRSINVTRHV